MKNKSFFCANLLLFYACQILAQNYTFDFTTSGKRVCLVSSEVDIQNNTVKILFQDSLANNVTSTDIYKRPFKTQEWTKVAADLPPLTGHWTDTSVQKGEIWEYQIKRKNTWNYGSDTYDATGYTLACVMSDNTDYKGQMILLVADDIPAQLPFAYKRLKKEITADGWLINEIIVPRATSWDSGEEVILIKNKINGLFNEAPIDDKPKTLFILGHVPLPRCGSTDVIAPDDHNENKGARGCDMYYADIDGVFTDTATYNPGGLATTLAINFPGDFKWDQDFFPSDIEMAFGRIDFADITEIDIDEITMTENYLNRLSFYKNERAGWSMGEKSGFFFGYDNSNDGSYRSLPNISGQDHVYQNYDGLTHNEWVQKNGPFKIYMQNLIVPELRDWQDVGMEATVYTSDQSYWGFGDAPQPNGLNSRIRSLLGIDTKCLIILWTTTGLNIFHQACSGLSFGESLKPIMNHNASNQYLEKPPQDFDTEDWWNRSHFAFWGDPTVNLFQVAPPGNVFLESNPENEVYLLWTPSVNPDVIGYHIYESETEFGKYTKLTTSFLENSRFLIPNYKPGKWYMVKAVKIVTSGCGTFLHAGIGNAIQGDIILNTRNLLLGSKEFKIFPNPSSDNITIQAKDKIAFLSIYNQVGKKLIEIPVNSQNRLVELNDLPCGMYIMECRFSDQTISYARFIKN